MQNNLAAILDLLAEPSTSSEVVSGAASVSPEKSDSLLSTAKTQQGPAPSLPRPPLPANESLENESSNRGSSSAAKAKQEFERIVREEYARLMAAGGIGPNEVKYMHFILNIHFMQFITNIVYSTEIARLWKCRSAQLCARLTLSGWTISILIHICMYISKN